MIIKDIFWGVGGLILYLILIPFLLIIELFEGLINFMKGLKNGRTANNYGYKFWGNKN